MKIGRPTSRQGWATSTRRFGLVGAALLLSQCAPAACDTATPAAPADNATAGAADAGPAAPAAAPGAFLEPFAAMPTSPEPWRPANWDVTVHSRDDMGWSMAPMQAEHGSDCGGPPLTHMISSFNDAVFRCKDHMMTSINTEGYGVIYLTPDRLVDFSRGEAVISVDVSTLRASNRDWWDIWITPYDENLQLAGEDWYPDLQGPPRNAIHLRQSVFNSVESGFIAEQFKNFQMTELPVANNTGYEQVLQPDAARRDRFELRIGNGRLRFGMPAYNLWWVDRPIGDLGFTQGVVQFGHHSYNPFKDDQTPNARAGTWHWDNVSISPSVPFSIVRATTSVTTSSTPVGFDRPAPAAGRLRFTAYGQNIEVSFDDGRTWQRAEAQTHRQALIPDHYVSYWTPVPAGTSSVRFRGGAGWTVRNISIFSR